MEWSLASLNSYCLKKYDTYSGYVSNIKNDYTSRPNTYQKDQTTHTSSSDDVDDFSESMDSDISIISSAGDYYKFHLANIGNAAGYAFKALWCTGALSIYTTTATLFRIVKVSFLDYKSDVKPYGKFYYTTLLTSISKIVRSVLNPIILLFKQLNATLSQDFYSYNENENKLVYEFKTVVGIQNLINFRNKEIEKKSIPNNSIHIIKCIITLFTNLIVIPLAMIAANVTSSLFAMKFVFFAVSGVRIPYRTGFGRSVTCLTKSFLEALNSIWLIVKDIFYIFGILAEKIKFTGALKNIVQYFGNPLRNTIKQATAGED